VAAHESQVAGLGVDAEPITSFSPDMEELLFGDDERESFAEMPQPRLPELSWAAIAFCAKEAFYKSYFPLTNQFLEFRDVAVTLSTHENGICGAFAVRFCASPGDDAQECSRFRGRWSVGHGLILAGAAVAVGA
jgi:4'-phosphopantetheinyl transferase EntD